MYSVFRQIRVLALTALTAVFAAKAQTDDPPTAPAKRMANTTWGSYLDPRGAVPVGSFKAFYINTNSPRLAIASETVDDIAINYAWKDFHDIRSEDFGAYWVGKLKFVRPETRLIEISQSWAKARVMIDKEIVYEGADDARVSYEFSKGTHLIEVEYINNWHTTEFRVIFAKQIERLTKPQVLDAIAKRGIVEPEVHYLGVYESNAKNLAINLYPSRDLKKAVLILSSYSPVRWKITGAAQDQIAAIVYGSSKPGSDVSGPGAEKALLLPYQGAIGQYELTPRCSCTATTYHCDDYSSLISTKLSVEGLTGGRLVSFRGAYGATDFAIPGTPVNDEAIQKVQMVTETQQKEREQCSRNADPDFENMR